MDGEKAPKVGRTVLLDTSATPAQATAKWIRMSQSKENLVHRGIVAALLAAIRERDRDSSILVLSPFRAQKLAYERERTTNRFGAVRFATVHTSQGTEDDIVVLDLVLAPGRGTSRFLDEQITPEFRNLLNVAISRAKRQLIFVAHSDQIRKQYPDGLLTDILARVSHSSGSVRIPADLRVQALFRELCSEPC
jgi:superfamily I DNA and/or RNA helicase